MKKTALIFLSIAGILFTACAKETPKPREYNEIIGLEKDENTTVVVKKVEHSIKYQRDVQSTATHSKPTIMISLMLSNVDEDNNHISDRTIDTIIDYGSWDSEPKLKFKKEF